MNKINVADLETLKQEYKDSEKKFINKYKKAEIFIGDDESINFIKDVLKKANSLN